MDDIDIWRAANLLVKRYGKEASTHATQRAEELLNAGDPEGSLVTAAINALQATEPGGISPLRRIREAFARSMAADDRKWRARGHFLPN